MARARRVLALIPARGGSVGLPRKNVRPLAGVPLIAHAIRIGHACQAIARTIVSTDDEEIAAVAKSYGGDVPFLRPAALATDTACVFDAIRHAVSALEEAGDIPYDDIVLLQPTSPLRLVADVDACLDALWRSGADSAITIYRHPQIHPRVMYAVGADGTAIPVWSHPDRMPRRQELEPVAIRAGVVYAFRASLVRTGTDIYGRRTVAVEIPRERGVGIDDARDFALCEQLAREHPEWLATHG